MVLAELFTSRSITNLQSAVAGDMHSLIVHSPAAKADVVLSRLISEQFNDNDTNVITVGPTEGETSIGIAATREVTHMASMSSNKQTLVVISPASALTKEAQNSLLKTLEQPSRSTKFILVANPSQLLPTIVSRSQTFAMPTAKPKALASALSLGKLDQGLTLAYSHDLDQLLAISEDKTKLITARQHIDTAKAIISNKAKVGDVYTLDKQVLSQLIELCLTITEAQLRNVHRSSLSRLDRQYKALAYCQKLLRANVSPKLVAAKLAML